MILHGLITRSDILIFKSIKDGGSIVREITNNTKIKHRIIKSRLDHLEKFGFIRIEKEAASKRIFIEQKRKSLVADLIKIFNKI